MTKRALIAPAQWQAFLRGVEAGNGIKASALSANISFSSANRYLKQLQAEAALYTIDASNKAKEDFGIQRAIPYTQLSPMAKRGWNDIDFFAERYFGFVLLPWHREAVKKIIELYDSTEREYVVINCPPGVGKPLALKTLVNMADGTRKALGEIRVGDYVISQKGRACKVTEVHEQGFQPSVIIKTKLGREVTAAIDHPFLTEAGYVNAGELLADARLPLVAYEAVSGSYRDSEEFRLAGYFVGDGCCVSGNASVTSNDLEVLEDFELCLKFKGWYFKRTEDTRSTAITSRASGAEGKGGRGGLHRNGPQAWLAESGLQGHTSHTKRVPPWVFTAPNDRIAEFLGAYFACDGHVSNGGQIIEFYSVNKLLLADVQTLLNRMGIASSLRSKLGKYKAEDHHSYRLSIRQRELFAQNIPVVGQKAKRLSEVKQYRPFFFHDIVESVKPIDPVECRCLTVEKDHTFLAEDLPVHNTTFFCKVVPLWLTVRDRSLRGLLGSSTFNKGVKLSDALRRELVRKIPVRPESSLVKNGVAVNASGVLSRDFGAFKPNIGKEVWRREEFVVIQHEEVDIAEKEPTWQAFGYGSDLIGNRVDFMIWDDLFELRSMKAQESREDLKTWWDSTIESRLEPGGLLILEGQRLHPDDIYRYALDKKTPVDLEDESPADLFIETLSATEIAELAQERQAQAAAFVGASKKLYEHISFKAHYDDKCQDFVTHKPGAKAYPEGCLLYPSRLSWRFLAPKRLADPHVWATVYQQEDSTQEAQIFQPVWINGGTGTDGVDYPGCWDNDRALGEIPPDLKAPIYSVATVDPSVTNFWSIQWWLIQPETEQRWLIDIYNKRLRSEDFLNYQLSTGEYTGIMNDWQDRSQQLNHPITHWIVERNAAQKWLLAHDYGLTWMRKNNTQIVEHYTARNKADPGFGVEAILPNVYRLGKARWPGKGRYSLSRFYNELIRYNPDPAAHNGTDDNIMAHWFLEWNMRYIHTPHVVLQRKKKFKWYEKKAG